MNVAVIVNENSSNSVQLGNYYMERRHVPSQNLLRTTWTGGNVVWTLADFSNVIYVPFQAMLASRQLTNQIDYVVLSMDFPYATSLAGNSRNNSTTSTLFYGYKPDNPPPNSCDLPPSSANAYAGSEGIFRQTPPINAASNSYLVTMITASNLTQAKMIVDNGVLGDSTFPNDFVVLSKYSGDPVRNVRFDEFDNTVFDSRVRGYPVVERTNWYQPAGIPNLLGWEGGAYGPGASASNFVPGALVDNLTSFSGQMFQDTAGQTTVLDFLTNGAAASYGTVDEPCDYEQKFPDSQVFFYQSRGFSAAECYYMGVTNPYMGMVAGEPLSAAFAQPGSGAWSGLSSNAVLSGTTNLSVQLNAADAQHPLEQVDLFVDGKWWSTLTNIAPHQNNTLTVTLNGHATTYTVPGSATIKSVTTGVVSALNTLGYSNLTKVLAVQHGDRVELQSLDSSKMGSQVTLSVTNGGTAPNTTFIYPSRGTFLDTVASGLRFYSIMGTPTTGDVLQIAVTKTNGAVVNLAVTNTVNGTTLGQLTQQLINLINSTPSLQGSDGLTAADLLDGGSIVQFDLEVNGAGYAAAQITASLTAPGLNPQPVGTLAINDNLADLEPRNHFYITAGVTNLGLTFPLNTTQLADGYHLLTAVAYEGSHVRTQTRLLQSVVVSNTAFSANFTTLVGGTNAAVEGTLKFRVAANTGTVSKIELFSTGGSLGATNGQSTVTFNVPGTNLDLGLHPFYAVVTWSGGQQYRTPATWVRLIGTESPFELGISAHPTTINWAATAARSYDVLSTTNLNNGFQVRTTIVATNNLAQWVETNGSPAQEYYRVRVTP